MSVKRKNKFSACLRVIRPYHATKNFLLFIPLFVGHQYFNTIALKNIFFGFWVFCCLASSAYVINDLVDLESDKQHFNKAKRPFAAGELPIVIGIILAFYLVIAALGISWYLPLNFLIVASSYYGLTLLYSFFIKQKRWLDVFLLAILYSLRVVAGMTLIEKGFSFWLIFFVLFLFFSLALLKRYAELCAVELRKAPLWRGYRLNDKNKLIFLGTFSGYLSILVFIFYIYSAKATFFYQSPLLLWLICPCLFIWLKHIWRAAKQGEIHDDPVLFTIRDKVSWAILGLIITVWLLATCIKSF